MGFIDQIYERIRGRGIKIAVPEAHDPVMLRAAAQFAQEGLGEPVAVGDEAAIRALCRELGVDEGLFAFADTGDESARENVAARYAQLPNVMLSEKAIMRRTADPLSYALALEAVGDVQCTFAGLVATTHEVIMAAQMIIGLADGVTTPSSFGIAEVEAFGEYPARLFGFGDSVICVDPSSEDLASIAISCCDSFRALVEREPRCALISYSTCGSGEGDDVDRVREALELAQQARPDLAIDGEFQLDAAVNQAIGTKKVTRPSEVAGRADLLIWPNLNVGNVMLKAFRHLIPAKTYGPIMQGFRLPVCDSSRGDGEQAIVDNMALSIAMALARAEQ